MRKTATVLPLQPPPSKEIAASLKPVSKWVSEMCASLALCQDLSPTSIAIFSEDFFLSSGHEISCHVLALECSPYQLYKVPMTEMLILGGYWDLWLVQ